MKRILLSILVIGILLLSACGAPTTAPPAEAPPTPSPAEAEPAPAKFTLTNLQAIPRPDAGENVYDISVDVENTGSSKGVYQLSCKIDDNKIELYKVDGKQVQPIEVELNPGEKKTVTLSAAELIILGLGSQYKKGEIDQKEHIISVDGLSTTVTFIKPAPRAKPEKEWEIIDIDAKVTEENPVWWKYSWKLVLRNNGSSPLVFNATIEFLDADGFIIDDDFAYDLRVEPGEEKTFAGYALVDTSIAPNIESVHAKVKER